jgi:hypothetical protein
MKLSEQLELLAEVQGWIGFDLDATIAKYYNGQSKNVVGKLIDGEATKLLKKFLKEGKRCKIVTARVGSGTPKEIAQQTKLVEKWTLKFFGVKLPVVAHKDSAMIMLYDDRATGVEPNTGKLL